MATYRQVASSNGSRTYTVIHHDNGSWSCACPAWRFQNKANTNRSCKHVRQAQAAPGALIIGAATPQVETFADIAGQELAWSLEQRAMDEPTPMNIEMAARAVQSLERRGIQPARVETPAVETSELSDPSERELFESARALIRRKRTVDL